MGTPIRRVMLLCSGVCDFIFYRVRSQIMLMRRLDKARIGGRVVKRLVAEVQQQEFFDQIYVIDKLQVRTI